MRVPGDVQTNQAGELTAILHALETIPKALPLRIVTDSKYCLNDILYQAKTWEERGWIDVETKELLKAVVA